MGSLAGHWLAQSIEQGVEKGERIGVEKVAIAMLRASKPIKGVVELTGLTSEHVSSLAAEITQQR